MVGNAEGGTRTSFIVDIPRAEILELGSPSPCASHPTVKKGLFPVWSNQRELLSSGRI
jgi:hypothetical protein